MRHLAILLLFASCTQAVSQNPSADLKSDQEFNALINKFNKTAALNKAAQKVAEHHAEKIVTKTVEHIVQLKTDVSALKTELVQVKEAAPVDYSEELSYFQIALYTEIRDKEQLIKANKILQDSLVYYKSKK